MGVLEADEICLRQGKAVFGFLSELVLDIQEQRFPGSRIMLQLLARQCQLGREQGGNAGPQLRLASVDDPLGEDNGMGLPAALLLLHRTHPELTLHGFGAGDGYGLVEGEPDILRILA
ncbi:hypothetical protein D3C75_799520 [compost metagenome]